MIHMNHVHNVNDALHSGLFWLKTVGIVRNSRGGKVLRCPDPVITITEQPEQRVLFHPLRDANPFFHLAEAAWMLAGSNLAAPMVRLVANMASFSDDALVFHGAYGHRWRHYFATDQLVKCIHLLRKDPSTRRACIGMWDPCSDLDIAIDGGKDVPCNTTIYFAVDGRELDMTVCCRSNDAVWGAHGANAVHFSVLQEFIALAVGLRTGKMTQFSNDYHVYLERPDVRRLFEATNDPDPRHWWIKYDDHASRRVYSDDHEHTPLLQEGELSQDFLEDCARMVDWLCDSPGIMSPRYVTSFFQGTVSPMLMAYLTHKEGHQTESALTMARDIVAHDWREASLQWLGRRLANARS